MLDAAGFRCKISLSVSVCLSVYPFHSLSCSLSPVSILLYSFHIIFYSLLRSLAALLSSPTLSSELHHFLYQFNPLPLSLSLSLFCEAQQSLCAKCYGSQRQNNNGIFIPKVITQSSWHRGYTALGDLLTSLLQPENTVWEVADSGKSVNAGCSDQSCAFKGHHHSYDCCWKRSRGSVFAELMV